MADQPYALDPFTMIKSINFGSDVWLGLIASAAPLTIGTTPTPPDITQAIVDMSFPGLAGGTPGFTLFNSLVPISGANPEPYTVTKADLTRPIKTGAGAGSVGFSAYQVSTLVSPNPPFNTYHVIQVGTYVKCSGVFAKRFTVQANMTAGNHNTDGIALVAIIQQGIVKAGVQLPPGPAVTMAQNTTFGGAGVPDPKTATFVVDPKALTVTGPF